MVSAADTLVQIRNFRTVSVMSCSGLTEVENDDGTTTVEFSVVLTYDTSLMDEGEESTEALDGADGTVDSTEAVESTQAAQ
jgi:hypothetical protein